MLSTYLLFYISFLLFLLLVFFLSIFHFQHFCFAEWWRGRRSFGIGYGFIEVLQRNRFFIFILFVYLSIFYF